MNLHAMGQSAAGMPNAAAIGYLSKELGEYRVGGVCHFEEISGLLEDERKAAGGAKLTEQAMLLLDAARDPGPELVVKLVAIPKQSLALSADDGCRINPFRPGFPESWTAEKVIRRAGAIAHLPLSWAWDFAKQVDPDAVSRFVLKGMIQLWWGSPQLLLTDGSVLVCHVTRHPSDHGPVFVKATGMPRRAVDNTNGNVIFGLSAP